MTATKPTPYEQALVLLQERDIDRPDSILANLNEHELVGVLGAIAWWDDRRRTSGNLGSGVLVNCIREGGKPGYGQHSESKVPKPITPRLLQAVRGRCLSPDGARRSEVLDMFEDAAKRRGVTADELVSQAMGPHWQLTPPHPALLQHADGRRWERYGRWVSAGGQSRPDLAVERGVGESLLSFCSRFWRWEEA